MHKDFSLLETILYTPAAGFFLLEEHIKRLLKAMQDFNSLDSTLFEKKITKQKIIDYLNCKVPNDGKYYRVRLLVDVDSNMHIEHTQLPIPSFSYESLEDAANSEPHCNVVLDKEPILEKPSNPFIIHKTTRRDMYNKSRERTSCDWHAALDKPFDVVLWNERGEITETSIANIAIRVCEDGKYVWKTPKVECGLLPGVFRSFLISSNQNVIEDVINVEDLKRAQKEDRPIVCFNSVRKLYRVRLLSENSDDLLFCKKRQVMNP